MKTPELRFNAEGSLGDSTETVLGNIVQIKSGTSPSSYSLSRSGKYPFLKVEELNNCQKYQQVSRNYSNTNKGSVPRNSVIFPKRGAAILTNKVRITVIECLLDSNLMALIPDREKLNYEYLYQFLIKEELHRIADTSSIPQINNKHIEPLKICVPPLEEQAKIANFLTAVDTKISQLTKKHELLTLYKKGVMQKIFSQELRFKDNEGREFAEWSQISFADIANINMGQSPDSSTYNQDSLGLPLIQGNADIVNRKTSPRAWTSEPTKKCNPGDLILTVRAPVGAIAKSSHAACIGRGVCAITAKENVSMEFLYQLLFWFESYKWKAIEQGSTFTAVSGEDIRNLNVMSPAFKEQTKIANFLTAIDDKITNVKSQLEAAKEYKQGLLQQMFV